MIIDSDLARLYGVSTSRLNEQVRRNERRFPGDFLFRLTVKEAVGLSQIATALGGRNLRKLPLAYTEHGSVMAANVLNSEKAIIMSVEVVRAFVRLRRAILSQGKIARKVAELELAVKGRMDRQDERIDILFKALAALIGGEPPPKKRIGFEP